MKKIVIFLAIASTMLFSCQNDDSPAPDYVPAGVMVGLNTLTTPQLLAFINQTGLEVEYIEYMAYTSALQPEDLEYAIDYFNSQPFINAQQWSVYGYVNGPGTIELHPHLYGMHNSAYQNSLLQTMAALQLSDLPGTEGPQVMFTVPEGQEQQWVTAFNQMEAVNWADLDHAGNIPQ